MLPVSLMAPQFIVRHVHQQLAPYFGETLSEPSVRQWTDISKKCLWTWNEVVKEFLPSICDDNAPDEFCVFVRDSYRVATIVRHSSISVRFAKCAPHSGAVWKTVFHALSVAQFER